VLNILLFVNLGAQGVDISNNSSINKVDKCIIYKLVVDRAGVEDGEVGVLNTRAMEVGVEISVSMKSHAIDRVAFLVTSLFSHTIPN
jgi:hypothetical protein